MFCKKGVLINFANFTGNVVKEEDTLHKIKHKPVIQRSSHWSYSTEKDVPKNLAKSQENTFARVSFLIKLQALVCNFMKKETMPQVFFWEFCKVFKNTFFIEHLRTTASAAASDLSVLEILRICFIRYLQTYSFLHFSILSFFLVISTRFGMHENYEYYMNCKSRARNIDLFTADQVNLCWYERIDLSENYKLPHQLVSNI